MSYTPTQWSDGDIITAEKLNNIESGIEGVSSDLFKIIINHDSLTDTYSMNKTSSQIIDALDADKLVYVYYAGHIYQFETRYANETVTFYRMNFFGYDDSLFLVNEVFSINAQDEIEFSSTFKDLNEYASNNNT